MNEETNQPMDSQTGDNSMTEQSQFSPDEAAAALAMATHISNQVHFGGDEEVSGETETPQEDKGEPTEKPKETPSEPKEEPKEDLSGKFSELELNMNKKLDEIRKELKEDHTKEMESLKKDIKDALNEEEE